MTSDEPSLAFLESLLLEPLPDLFVHGGSWFRDSMLVTTEDSPRSTFSTKLLAQRMLEESSGRGSSSVRRSEQSEFVGCGEQFRTAGEGRAGRHGGEGRPDGLEELVGED